MAAEDFQRLSASAIWHKQRQFYSSLGHEAFRATGIPFEITSNPAIAHAYAAVVAAWIGDRVLADPGFAHTHAATPLRLLELGPGTGRFTFLFTRELRRLLASRELGHLRTRHVCADVSEPLLRDLAAHPALRELVEQELLEFVVFDAEHPADSRLGELDTGSGGTGPVVVVCNYVLDSLTQDCFFSTGTQLYESEVQPCGEGEADTYFRFRQRPISLPYYGDAELDDLLEQCWQRETGLLQFPATALRLLRWLWEFSGGQLLLLAADKAYYAAAEMLFPAVEGYGDGCVSMMVNFAPLELFWQRRGGRFFKAHRKGASLSYIVAESKPAGSGRSGGLGQIFAEHFGNQTPEDWSTLSWRVVRDMERYELAEMLAVLRLSRWDPMVFRDCFPSLLRAARGADTAGKSSLREAAQKTAALYYFLHEVPDTYFLAGSVVYETGAPAEALRLFQAAAQASGETPPILFQMARCLYHLYRRREALALSRRALEAEPRFEDYLLATGILPERRAAWLVAQLEWEISLPGAGATGPIPE